MNNVIDKGFRSCRFVSTIVKHPVHKDKAQVCSFEEHPCCNTRISRQMKWCSPLRPHGHWVQLNS